MTNTDTNIDLRIAQNIVRRVVNGEAGELLEQVVANAIYDLRGMDPDDREDAIHELADVAVPIYTYQRMQMFAESIHIVTFESDMAQPTTDPVELVGAILYEIIETSLRIALEEKL